MMIKSDLNGNSSSGLITALYCRLSSEDKNHSPGTDSNSITNQKQMLRAFADAGQFVQCRYYIDDGWSGTNFNRPAYQSLMNDIEHKLVGTVIVKDLSRLGRNYLKVGELIEIVFPSRGVRFIAVNDNVDTASAENELMVFKNLFNDWYARDTSKKIKAVKYAKAAKGERTNGSYPYGYRPSPGCRSRLIVDEEAAAAVRLIFREYNNGASLAGIIRLLGSRRILSPSAYRYLNHMPPCSSKAMQAPYTWNSKTLYDILSRREYLGDTVTHKYSVASYKTHQSIKLPAEDQFIFEHTHEPIIDHSTWDAAQRRLQVRTRPTRLGTVDLYSGLVYCGDCGKKMTVYRSARTSSHKECYMCSGYKQGKYGPSPCTAHYIRKDILDSIILFSLSEEFNRNPGIKNKLTSMLAEQKNLMNQRSLLLLDRESEKLRTRCQELDCLFKHLYEDMVTGSITKAHYNRLSKDYEEERTILTSRLDAVESKKREAVKPYNDASLPTLADSYLTPASLSYGQLREYIDKIIIYETNKASMERTIEIYYRFTLPVD